MRIDLTLIFSSAFFFFLFVPRYSQSHGNKRSSTQNVPLLLECVSAQTKRNVLPGVRKWTSWCRELLGRHLKIICQKPYLLSVLLLVWVEAFTVAILRETGYMGTQVNKHI